MCSATLAPGYRAPAQLAGLRVREAAAASEIQPDGQLLVRRIQIDFLHLPGRAVQLQRQCKNGRLILHSKPIVVRSRRRRPVRCASFSACAALRRPAFHRYPKTPVSGRGKPAFPHQTTVGQKFAYRNGTRCSLATAEQGLAEDIAVIHGSFTAYLRKRGFADFTIEHFQRRLVRVARWLCEHRWRGRLSKLTRQMLSHLLKDFRNRSTWTW